MAKYKEGNYYHAYKVIDDKRLDGLHYLCIYIYQIMQELEHKYTSEDKQFFYRSDEDFAKDCRMPLTTFKRYKGILVKHNQALIETNKEDALFIMCQSTFYNPKTGKSSTKHISNYIFPD